MRWFTDRLSRLRWVAVPMIAYLAITLALPLANGAARRGDFARHAGWVLGGCLAMVVVIIVGAAAWELARAALRRVVNNRGPSHVGERA
jgi:hypothetical protein